MLTHREDVLCVGAGPAGLYAAYWLRRRAPHYRVRVVDGRAAGSAYGFGVVFSQPTIDAWASRDPDLVAYLQQAGHRWDDISVTLRGEELRCAGQGYYAIARASLLAWLEERARSVGVELELGRPIRQESDLAPHSLLIGADGARSAVRSLRADSFRPTVNFGRTRFVWLGTTKVVDALAFVFRANEHGGFGLHAYPHSAGGSTFLVETSEDTWLRTGLNDDDAARQEARTVAYLTDLFADTLEGHTLSANRSLWQRFRVVAAERWAHERAVLIGDAAHTAHFSTGSGTKAALEDGYALAHALTQADTPEEGLAAYERTRRPEVEHLLLGATPSLEWWERFETLLDWPIEAFMAHFLTRNHRVRIASVGRRDPQLMRRMQHQFAATQPDGTPNAPASCPFSSGAFRAESRYVEVADDGSAAQRQGAVLLQPAAPPSSRGDTAARWAFRHVEGAARPAGVVQGSPAWVQLAGPRATARAAAELRDLTAPSAPAVLETTAKSVLAMSDDARRALKHADGVYIAKDSTWSDSLRAGDVTRNDLGLVTILEVPSAEEAQTALLGRRADLVRVREGLADAEPRR